MDCKWRLKRCESSSFQPGSFFIPLFILCFTDCPGLEDAVMWLCTETLPHSEHRHKGQRWCFWLIWLSLTSLREQSTHGKNEGLIYLLFYVCAFIQLHAYIQCSCFWLSFFFNGEQHGFLLWLVTSVKPRLLSKLCCYSLGSLLMTAFTHNVCALFCKLMVVDVCLLLMYIHYESCLRHSMSLSELLLCFWTNSPWPKKEEHRE